MKRDKVALLRAQAVARNFTMLNNYGCVLIRLVAGHSVFERNSRITSW